MPQINMSLQRTEGPMSELHRAVTNSNQPQPAVWHTSPFPCPVWHPQPMCWWDTFRVPNRMRVKSAGKWYSHGINLSFNWNSSLQSNSAEMPPNDIFYRRKISVSGWLPLRGSNHLGSLQVSFFMNFIFSLAGDNNIQWADPTLDNYYQNWSCSFNWKKFSSSLPA